MTGKNRFIYIFVGVIFILSALVTFGISGFITLKFSTLGLLSLFLHNLGFVFGTGGAIIVNAFNIILEKDEKLKSSKLEIISTPLKFVWIGLILMLIVHTGELITEQNIQHIIKAIIIYAILIGLSYLQFSVISKIKMLTPKPDENPSEEFISAKRKTKIIPIILLALWLLDFVINTAFEPTHAFGFLS